MFKEDFKKQYEYLNAIYSGNYILFKIHKHRWELYNIETEETNVFKTFDAFASDERVAKIIENYIPENIEMDMPKSSRADATSIFGDQEGENGPDRTWNDFPSRVNTDKQKSNQTKTLAQFRSMYAKADKEHAFAVDEQGYITTYKHGNASSVTWHPSELAGKIVYHNHPSGSAFSKADLVTTSKTQATGIVASGKHGDYIFKKTPKFDSAGFQKALNSAKSVEKDYSKAVDKWLRRNAKKYGYVYEFRTY